MRGGGALEHVFVMDIGNSNTVLGVFEGETILQRWRIHTSRERTVDELGVLIRTLFRDAKLEPGRLAGVTVCSVVPPVMNTVEEMCRKYLGLEPIVVGPGIKTGLPVLTENPREVGADRIVNAVAAVQLYGAPIMIVNLGTATTVCVVDDRAQYIGGVIAPGLRIATDALYERAAKLPRIELSWPKSVIGRNTVHSMQSGVLYGFAGLVDGLVGRVETELTQKFRVVATGGMAELIGQVSHRIEVVNPDLSLVGLRLLWEKNR